eukprot:5477968-Lingulodinium_polyedra.AAC.1
MLSARRRPASRKCECRQARVAIHESAEEKTGTGFQECARECDAQKYSGLTGHALAPAQEKRILDRHAPTL